MKIANSVVFVTGANRGLGRELVHELLQRGATRVYAAARDTSSLKGVDSRVIPVTLDLTNHDQIIKATQLAVGTTLLINNASAAVFSDVFSADRSKVALEMNTNYLGLFDMINAFTPVIEKSGGGAIVNILSLLALSSTPPMAGYSASKAAAHSLTQAIRPALAKRGIVVQGVYPGGIDTDMLAGIDFPKTAPTIVAKKILDGVAADLEDIFPDPTSEQMSGMWARDPKAFELAFRGE